MTSSENQGFLHVQTLAERVELGDELRIERA